MAITTCTECNGRVSDKAAVCPHCGAPFQAPALDGIQDKDAAPPKKGGVWKWVIGVPVGLFVAMLVLGSCISNTPQGQEKAKARDAIDLCWKNQQRKSNSAGESQFIAGACERMEDEFIRKFGVRP